MYKLSEAAKMVGVTRRTLQEYDRIGLLHPTATNEIGYWLYDDMDVNRLMMIQVFVRAGYRREEIKCILNSPDIEKEMEKAICRMEQQRDQLNGLIGYSRIIKQILVLGFPDAIEKALIRINLKPLYDEKSFRTMLDENIRLTVSGLEPEKQSDSYYVRLIFAVTMVGSLCHEKLSAEERREYASALTECFMDYAFTNGIYRDMDVEAVKDLPDNSKMRIAAAAIKAIINVTEIQESIKRFGDNAPEFLIELLEEAATDD